MAEHSVSLYKYASRLVLTCLDTANPHNKMARRILFRALIAAVLVTVSALLLEFVLEARDKAQFLPGQAFATVGDAKIRYKLTGKNRTAATVVILSGLSGSIEQDDELQSAVAQEAPTLTYDRAGYGFSEGSVAHSACEQATELAALLDALRIQTPIVLVSYSFSADMARVFAGRYPEKLAGMYMIAPSMPNLHELVPAWHHPVRRYARVTAYNLVASSLGYLRLRQRLESWAGPESEVEQRAQAVLARRSHYWALAQEWYALSESTRQALEAHIPPSVPIEVAIPKPEIEDETSKALSKLDGDLVAHSSHGRLIELQDIDHSELIKSGPAFDRMVADIKHLAKNSI